MNDIQTWTIRAALKDSIRGFFGERSYLEIDTPIMVNAPGMEVHLDYFSTNWRDLHSADHPKFLQSSPELHMKRALCHGATRVFQFAKCFRNGGEYSEWHNPEFTMLEWYETNLSYQGCMEQTEELLHESFQYITTKFDCASPLKLPKRFTRLTLAEAFKQYAHIDLVDQDPDLGAKAKAAGCLSIQPLDDFETAFFKVLIEKVEPRMAELNAVILCDYPASMAVLARVEHGVAQRFEIYVGRVELCNAFAELADPKENKVRWDQANEQRVQIGKAAITPDGDFLRDLHLGLPNCSGNALGFDRWLALILGHKDLNRVIPFRKPF